MATRTFRKNRVGFGAWVAAGLVAVMSAASAQEPSESPAPRVTEGAAQVAKDRPAAPAPTPAQLRTWVGQLSSTHYALRERATQRLISAGAKALDAVAEAASSGDLETSYRAVRVLQVLLANQDAAVQQRAEKALVDIAAEDGKPAAKLANEALTLFYFSKQPGAIEELRRLNAEVYADDPYGVAVMVLVNKQWEGAASDLKRLREIPGLRSLTIRGVRLDDETIDMLCQFSHVAEIKLYGTGGVASRRKERLVKALPDTDVDCRNALLGVGSEINAIGCRITTVQVGSAADQADIRVGDEITAFDGRKVETFLELTELIGDKQPGEKAAIEIRRGAETLAKSVTLGEWE